MENSELYSVSIHTIRGLKQLAIQTGYKPLFPTFPKKETPDTVRGFEGRWHNWSQGLQHHVRNIKLNEESLASKWARSQEKNSIKIS